MHLPVSHSAATIATLGVNHNFAREFTGSRVKAQRTLLQLKSSTNRVQHVAEGEIHGEVLGINGMPHPAQRPQCWRSPKVRVETMARRLVGEELGYIVSFWLCDQEFPAEGNSVERNVKRRTRSNV